MDTDPREVRARLERDGFAVLPQFFAAETCDRILEEVALYTGPQRANLDTRITVDISHGPHCGRLVCVRDAPAEAFTGSFKLNNLFTESSVVAEALFEPRLTRVLGRMLDDTPVAINSLNFKYGSQQPDHIDTWYMPPPKAGSLVVASISLEDVRPDAGPLFYYPGSHLIPPYVFSHGGIHAVDAEMPDCQRYLEKEVAQRGLKKETFLGRKGDVFLWHCQLLHGGSPILDREKSRASLVVHYWGEAATRPQPLRTGPFGGKFLDRDYWRTDGKPIASTQSSVAVAAVTAAAAPSSTMNAEAAHVEPSSAPVAGRHIAFETWEARGEALESVEARIHDGAPTKLLHQRATSYLEMMDKLFPKAAPKASSRVMEIGSGVGYVLEEALRRYQPASIVGLDIAAGMIEHARQRLRRDGVDSRAIEFVHYDGIDVPLPDASIDYIYSVASLQHAPRAYCFRALMEAWRLLRPGGAACFHLLAYSHFSKHMTPEAFNREVHQQIHQHQGHWHHYYSVEEIQAVSKSGIGVPDRCLSMYEQEGSLWFCYRKR
ncbi:MAG: methyltransferase domain-containing protein [Rudaea sp.]|nr:methyltransferase domain-containing protein [Rudaea sp.]